MNNNETLLEFAIEKSHVGAWVLDLENHTAWRTLTHDRIFGYGKLLPHWTYEMFLEHVLPEDRAEVDRRFQESVSGRSEWRFECRIRRVDGEIRWISAVGGHELTSEGIPVRMSGIVQDITDSRHSEEEVRKLNHYTRSLIEASIDSLVTISPSGKITDVNTATETITGRTRTELIGTDFCDYFTEPEKARTGYEQVFREGFVRDYLLKLRNCNGQVTPVLYNATVYRDESGQVAGVFAVARDISEIERAEAAIRAEQQRFRDVLDQLPAYLILLSQDYHVKYANRFFRERFGESKGRHCYEYLFNRSEPCENCETYTVLKTNTSHHWQWTGPDNRNYDIYDFPFKDIDGSQLVMEMGLDVTDRLILESQLRHAQKMESIGRLAGGVAHDFNNMLGVIIGCAEMVMKHVNPTQPIYANLQEILKAAERSANLTRQLLAFARKQTIAPIKLDLNKAVEGMLKMLQHLIGENIDLVWLPGEYLWPVKIDPTQIDQIMANLCANSRDAIIGIGKITIRTENCTLDEDYCATQENIKPGEYARLSVADNGPGIEPETLAHIFDPFFTTKEIGKGTGLGLASVYGAVKQNNGFIDVCSIPSGTIINIYLPRYAGTKSTEKTQTKKNVNQPVGGHETILLVEDEISILNLILDLLKSQGYTVLGAKTPHEAIRIAQEYTGKIHLLITDVIMPEMNGEELCKHLLEQYPKLKWLFMSGYAADVITSHGIMKNDDSCFIQKPFSLDDLSIKVREAIKKKK